MVQYELMTSRAERDRFDELFEQVLDELPEEIQELLDELPIVLEDEPSREVLAEMGIEARPGEADLCGLHSALPLPESRAITSGGSGPAYPGPIFLFRGPILRLAGWEPEALEHEIRTTLLHELGHHMGWDEEMLEKLGYE